MQRVEERTNSGPEDPRNPLGMCTLEPRERRSGRTACLVRLGNQIGGERAPLSGKFVECLVCCAEQLSVAANRRLTYPAGYSAFSRVRLK